MEIEVNESFLKLLGGDQEQFALGTKWYPGIDDSKRFVNPKVHDLIPKGILPPRIKRDDIPHKLKYDPRLRKSPGMQDMVKVCHNGQRKLFICELQHLTAIMDSLDERALIIYAGAAPTNKSKIYADGFNNSKFILIDPNEFNIYSSVRKDRVSHYSDPGDAVVYMSVSSEKTATSRYDYSPKLVKHYATDEIIDLKDLKEDIPHEVDSSVDYILNSNHQMYIFNEYMTCPIAALLNQVILKGNFSKVLFWSDIRTNMDGEGTGDSPSDTDIIANTAWTYSWLRVLSKNYPKQIYFMLKFRLPYLEGKVKWDVIKDVIDEARIKGFDYKKTFEEEKELYWFPGEVYIQAFAGPRSAEARLWGEVTEATSNDLVKHELGVHEDIMFYYNAVERFGAKYENSHSDPKIGFDHCGDCAIESKVYQDFVQKFYDPKSEDKRIKILVYYLSKITNRSHARNPHGHNF